MMNGIHPWKLSKETIKLQYQKNEAFRSQSNLEIVIKEVFDFDMKIHNEVVDYDAGSVQTNKNLTKMSDIKGAIKQRFPELNPKPAELRHLLKRLCGAYTSTTNRQKLLSSCKGHIENGIVMQGQWTRYVMPPQLTDFD